MSGFGEQKRRAIMRRYNRILGEHGKMAKFISKAVIYQEVALPFFVAPARIGVILLEELKKGNTCEEEIPAFQKDLDKELNILAEEERTEEEQ